MVVFRHLKCCDGWVFFVFLYSRWGLKRWVSCLLKWKRDRGSILQRWTVGEEKEKILLSSRKRKREKYCWSSERKVFSWVSMTDDYFLMLEVFWFADGYSSYIINVLSVMFKILFWQRRSSGTILLLACEVDVVDDVVEVSDAGIDDSSVERWLFLCWKPCRNFGRRNSRWKEELHIFVDEVLLRRRRGNPCKSSLSQKFFFPSFFLQMAAKSSSLSHVSFLKSMRTESTRALSFFFLFRSRYQHFAGQNDQLRLKSSKAALKAFQMMFPWLKMK